MKWYNKWIFDKLGKRRLMTRREFWEQVTAEVDQRYIRVLSAKEHSLLLDIAARANILVKHSSWTHRADDPMGRVLQYLERDLASYKLIEDDRRRNIPHSTIKLREVPLMSIGGIARPRDHHQVNGK